MKHLDQESLHAKNTPHRDPATSPTLSDMPVHQTQQGTFLSRVWTFFWRALHAMIQKMPRKRVPQLSQMNMVECGLTCLAMILSYYGRKTSLSELRTHYGVGRDGLSALGIVRAARNYGMRVRAISIQQHDLRFVKLPCIATWEFNQFLGVEPWTG